MTSTVAKGSAWRRKIELWLKLGGFRCTVRGIGYAGDDILAVKPAPGRPLQLSVEAKNYRTIELASFVDQAQRQAASYPPELGVLPVVIAHRKGRGTVDDAYVVMPGWAFIELVTR